MSLEGRIERLEEVHPDRPPTVIFYVMGDAPPLSEEEKERLIQEAIERDPGRPLYLVNVASSSSGR